MEYQHVGVVRSVRSTDRFMVGEVPGKIAMVISDLEAGDMLAYFALGRCPQTGTRVGAIGGWVQMTEPATRENSPPGYPMSPGGQRCETQLDVLAWQRVAEAYDWLLDRLSA
ncbi:MAG: hypothetical protein JKY65_15635 [Planctomycetes bacterium]|nr:hypothetical protein [Planctomycetota bacterium]